MGSQQKALILSGGGGRGAYHVGVIEALVEAGWMEDGKGPDILAGTSIGAINAAAIASGITVAQLKARWMEMHTEDVHRLSSDIPAVARPFIRFLLHSVLTSEAHGGVRPPLPDDEKMSANGLFERLGKLFQTHPFRGLLDTTPWRHTLSSWVDFERINSPAAPALLLTATDLQKGTLRVFCNRERKGHPPDTLSLDHLMASSSIPAIYPWTEIDNTSYWDGAVLANTPLGAVIDIATTDDIDILVVMMTPWYDKNAGEERQAVPLPHDIVQTLALTFDWNMLASYRIVLKLLQSYNDLVEAAEKLEEAAQRTGDDSLRLPVRGFRRLPLPTVIAPQKLMPLEWIVDYEEANHLALFEQGKVDALRTLHQRAETV